MPECTASGITATLLVSELKASLTDTVILTMGERQQIAAKKVETSLLKGRPLTEDIYSEGLSDLEPEFIGPECDMPVFMVIAKHNNDSVVENSPANINPQALALVVRTTAKTLLIPSNGKLSKKDIKIETLLNGELLHASFHSHRKMKDARAGKEEVNVYSGKRFHRQLEIPLTYKASGEHIIPASSWEDRWKHISTELQREADERGFIDGKRVHVGKYLAALADLPYPEKLVDGQCKPAVMDIIVTAGSGMKNGPTTAYIKSPTALRCVRKEDIVKGSSNASPLAQEGRRAASEAPQTPVKRKTKAESISTSRAHLKKNKVVRAAVKHCNGASVLVSENSSPNLLLAIPDVVKTSIEGESILGHAHTEPTPYHLHSLSGTNELQIHTSPLPDPFLNTDRSYEEDSEFGEIRIARDSSPYLSFMHSYIQTEDSSPSFRRSPNVSPPDNGSQLATYTIPAAMIPAYSINLSEVNQSLNYIHGYEIAGSTSTPTTSRTTETFIAQSTPKRKRQVSCEVEDESGQKSTSMKGRKGKTSATVGTPQSSQLTKPRADNSRIALSNAGSPSAARSKRTVNYYNPDEVTPRQALDSFEVPELCKDSVVSYAGSGMQRQITKERAGDFAEEVFVIGMRFIIV